MTKEQELQENITFALQFLRCEHLTPEERIKAAIVELTGHQEQQPILTRPN